MTAGIHRTVRPYGAFAHGPNPRQPMGVDMPVTGAGGVGATKNSWSPTVANLLVLVVLELVAFAAIRFLFKRVAH